MTGLLLLIVFLVLVAQMVSGRVPALLALPLLALATGVVAGLPYYLARVPPELAGDAAARWGHALGQVLTLLSDEIVAKGVPRLHKAVFAVMLGGVFGKLLELSGVAGALVRRVAELAGERVFPLTLALCLAVALLFTGLGGLGAVIMVANIVFPVLLSLGVPPVTVGGLFVMSSSLGGVFNLVNWSLYQDVLGMQVADVARFAVPFGLIYLVVLLVFVTAQLRKARLGPTRLEAGVALAGLGALAVAGAAAKKMGWLKAGMLAGAKTPAGLALLVLCVMPRRVEAPGVAAMAAPLVPITLVLFCGWPIQAAFVGGVLYLVAKGPGERREADLRKALVEGVQSVTPAICLMMGIGMVLVAFWHPSVSEVMTGVVRSTVPSSRLGFVVFFGALAPLALYRGPLNVWGMGFGLAGILHKAAVLSPRQIMVAFLSAGQLQGVCDPTNTYNVWISGQLRVGLIDLLRVTLPYVWCLAVLGLLLGAYGG